MCTGLWGTVMDTCHVEILRNQRILSPEPRMGSDHPELPRSGDPETPLDLTPERYRTRRLAANLNFL